jgi:pullulanase/glycogen debranching enzyme
MIHMIVQIIDLSAPALEPEGWSLEASPPQGPFTDISVYELHIRDFSASDETVPDDLRGKYLAFALVGLPSPLAVDLQLPLHSVL